MIWCVTLNPALDVTYRLDTPIQSGAIYRAKPIPRAGGKGNNVARAVATLGLAVTAVGIYGGMTGTVIRQLLAEDGIGCVYQETPMETRRCMTFTAGSHVAEVREPGAYIPVEDGATLLDMVQSRVASTDWVTLSGSLPSDWPPDTYAVWVDTLKPRVAGILVDTAGLPLQRAIRARPMAVVPNRSECRALSSETMGSTFMIVTLGNQGARWCDKGGEVWQAIPPAVTVRNTVGAGDSFLGGLVVALSRGENLRDAVTYGVAVGTSSVTTEAVGDVDRNLVDPLLKLTTVVRSDHDGLC